MRRISHICSVLVGLLLFLSASGSTSGELVSRRWLRQVAQEGQTRPTDHSYTKGTASSYQASNNYDFIPTRGVGATAGDDVVGIAETEDVAGTEEEGLETEMYGVLPSGLQDPAVVPGGVRVSGTGTTLPVPVGSMPTKPESVPESGPEPESESVAESVSPQTFATETKIDRTFAAQPTASVTESDSGTVMSAPPAQVIATEPAPAQVFPTKPFPGKGLPVQAESSAVKGLAIKPTPAQTLAARPAPPLREIPTERGPTQEISTEHVPAQGVPFRMGGDQSPRLAPESTPVQILPPVPAPTTQMVPTYTRPKQEPPPSTEAEAGVSQGFTTERIFGRGPPPKPAPTQGLTTESGPAVKGEEGSGEVMGIPSQLEGNPFFYPPTPRLPEPAVENTPEGSVQNNHGLCDLHPGQDYVSNENGEGVSVPGVAECCDRCLLKTDCVAFAFYSSGLCFLKHQIGQLMPNPMMTAGIMLRNGVEVAVANADSFGRQDKVTGPEQVAEVAQPHKGGGGGWVFVTLLCIVSVAGGLLVLRRYYNPRLVGRGWRPLQETEMGMLAGR